MASASPKDAHARICRSWSCRTPHPMERMVRVEFDARPRARAVATPSPAYATLSPSIGCSSTVSATSVVLTSRALDRAFAPAWYKALATAWHKALATSWYNTMATAWHKTLANQRGAIRWLRQVGKNVDSKPVRFKTFSAACCNPIGHSTGMRRGHSNTARIGARWQVSSKPKPHENL